MKKELFKRESSSWDKAFIAAKDRGDRMAQISHRILSTDWHDDDDDDDDGNDDENENDNDDEILFLHCDHLMANKSTGPTACSLMLINSVIRFEIPFFRAYALYLNFQMLEKIRKPFESICISTNPEEVHFLNLEISITLIVAIPGELGEISMIQITENKSFYK